MDKNLRPLFEKNKNNIDLVLCDFCTFVGHELAYEYKIPLVVTFPSPYNGRVSETLNPKT